MEKTLFTGSGVALVTPFTEDTMRIDYECWGRLIDWQIDSGTDALLVFGTTGEPSTILPEEKWAGVEFAVKRVAGRVPVVAGAGGNDTRRTIEQAVKIQALGANALLVVTPYYNKTTQAGLRRHYEMVADAVSIPIIMYNVPSRTGLNLLPATARALSDHPNIWGLKEASGDITQVAEAARLLEGRMTLYSGNDDHVLPILALGGRGVISVAANVVPDIMHELVMSYMQGDIERSRELQFFVNPLVQSLFTEVNPIPVKEAARLMGFGNGAVRMPLVPVSEGNGARIKAEMHRMGLI